MSWLIYYIPKLYFHFNTSFIYKSITNYYLYVLISWVSWNCRGLGHPLAIPTLCELVRVHRSNVIFLFETLAHKARVEEIRSRISFQTCFAVDCIGHGGVICVLWRDVATCSILSYNNSHIDLKVHGTIGEWRLTGFYGCLERHRRRESWNLLRRLSTTSNLLCIFMGEFQWPSQYQWQKGNGRAS